MKHEFNEEAAARELMRMFYAGLLTVYERLDAYSVLYYTCRAIEDAEWQEG